MWLKPQNLLKCTHGKSLFSCVSFTQFPYLQQTATVIGLLFILLETFTRHTGQLFVCLFSELGLKCLYLRPLWGYELRYVLITPVSHHHPLLSVFNLIRFYSFSPWMFFFPHQWGNMGSLHFIFILKLELESRGHASEVHQKYIFFLWHLLSLES